MPFLNVIIFTLVIFKVLFYLRSYNELAVVVQLLGQCIKEIFFFLMFMISSVLVFSHISILLGADYHAEQPSQEELGFFLRVIMQTWKNAIGDAGPPSFAQWEQLQNIHYMNDTLWPQFYIVLIWLVFIFNQLLIAVILLNFLIAMISQSYEQVMQHKSKSQYSQKGALNMELQLLKSVFLPEKSFDTIIIFSRNELWNSALFLMRLSNSARML